MKITINKVLLLLQAILLCSERSVIAMDDNMRSELLKKVEAMRARKDPMQIIEHVPVNNNQVDNKNNGQQGVSPVVDQGNIPPAPPLPNRVKGTKNQLGDKTVPSLSTEAFKKELYAKVESFKKDEVEVENPTLEIVELEKQASLVEKDMNKKRAELALLRNEVALNSSKKKKSFKFKYDQILTLEKAIEDSQRRLVNLKGQITLKKGKDLGYKAYQGGKMLGQLAFKAALAPVQLLGKHTGLNAPKDLGSKAINNVKEGVEYVVKSPIVDNKVVRSVAGLGSALVDFSMSKVKQAEDYVRTGLDLLRPNVTQNVLNPLSDVERQFNHLEKDALQGFILGNKHIADYSGTTNQKIAAIQSLLEFMMQQDSDFDIKTITEKDVRDFIDGHLNKYKDIKKILENILNQSYAEMDRKYTLVDALGRLSVKSDKEVEAQQKACKDIVTERFEQWIDEKIVKLEKCTKQEEVDSLQEQINLYTLVSDAVNKAIDMYGTVFLVDSMLQGLSDINTKEFKRAISLFQYFVKWQKEYATIDNTLSNDILVKQYIDNNAGADLVVKLNKEFKQSPDAIYSSFRELEYSIGSYVKVCSVLPSVTDYARLKSADILIQDVTKYLKTFSSSADMSMLTNVQKEKIEDMIDGFTKNANLLKEVLYLCSKFPTVKSVETVIDKYDLFCKVFKKYKAPVCKDSMPNITINMLTFNRLEGVKALVEMHGSVSKMIRWAEEKQPDYEKRQKERLVIAGNVIDKINREVSKLLKADKVLTDEDLEWFDAFYEEIADALDNSEYYYYNTTMQKDMWKKVVFDACEDAKNHIKVAIVAGWTVVGVKAKVALEDLANTEGSGAEAIVKRAFGKVANTVRKGFVGTGKKIAEKEYHKETREKIARKAGDIAGRALDLGEDVIDKVVELGGSLQKTIVEKIEERNVRLETEKALEKEQPEDKMEVTDLLKNDYLSKGINKVTGFFSYIGNDISDKLSNLFAKNDNPPAVQEDNSEVQFLPEQPRIEDRENSNRIERQEEQNNIVPVEGQNNVLPIAVPVEDPLQGQPPVDQGDNAAPAVVPVEGQNNAAPAVVPVEGQPLPEQLQAQPLQGNGNVVPVEGQSQGQVVQNNNAASVVPQQQVPRDHVVVDHPFIVSGNPFMSMLNGISANINNPLLKNVNNPFSANSNSAGQGVPNNNGVVQVQGQLQAQPPVDQGDNGVVPISPAQLPVDPLQGNGNVVPDAGQVVPNNNGQV